MSKFSLNKNLLAFVIGIFAFMILLPSYAFASDVTVTSIGLEETTIIEVTNDSDEQIFSVDIWLAGDFKFKSMKTEKGWKGEKSSEDIVTFTSENPLNVGESVKFGIKTDKSAPKINWKVTDSNGEQLDKGRVTPDDLPSLEDYQKLDKKDSSENDKNKTEVTEEKKITEFSEFRIIPERPNVGSTIRVTGDNFGSLEEFDFYIDSKKLGDFETDENGHFMTTMKIPENHKDGRVDFKVKDSKGGEKEISIRIGEKKDRIETEKEVPLTIKKVKDVAYRGDSLKLSGTGTPESVVIVQLIDEDEKIIKSQTTEVDNNGKWNGEPLVLALDMELGRYTVAVEDGSNSKSMDFSVESNKKINIESLELKQNAGDLMEFSGTGLPNIPMEVILIDPHGKEIDSDIIQLDKSGEIKYQYQTSGNSVDGTYTLVASQGEHKEFFYTGIGQLPQIPVNVSFDKLNYKSGDTAELLISGKPSEIVNLLVIDQSDRAKGEAVNITLQPDGRYLHLLELDNYSSGVYTVVISKGASQTTEKFSVGLKTGSGEIKLKSSKTNYFPGEQILILGDTKSNVLLTNTLFDPDGNEIRQRESFSDKSGKIVDDSFRIPRDAATGLWTINVKSGQNFDVMDINVVASADDSMAIFTEEGMSIAGLGDSIKIKVFGIDATVEITILSDEDQILANLEGIPTNDNTAELIWVIPPETEAGTYTIKADDGFNTAENTFEIE